MLERLGDMRDVPDGAVAGGMPAVVRTRPQGRVPDPKPANGGCRSPHRPVDALFNAARGLVTGEQAIVMTNEEIRASGGGVLAARRAQAGPCETSAAGFRGACRGP